MKRRGLAIAMAAVLAVLLLVGAAFLVRNVFFAPTKSTAYFPSATGIYAGDEVRISGVKVGKINSIDPDADCACHHALASAIMTRPDAIRPATRRKLDLLIGKYLPRRGNH